MIVGDLAVRVTDNDVAAVAVSAPASLAIAEGGQHASYEVALATQPRGEVTVYAAGDGQSRADPAALTFDATNWNSPQVVTVTAIDDAVDEDDGQATVINHAVAGADERYRGQRVAAIELTVADNDTSGVDVTPVFLGVPDGGVGVYSLVLATQPQTSVVVDILPDTRLAVDVVCAANDEGTACRVFTPENWNMPQQVAVLRPAALLQAFIDHEIPSGEARYLAVDVATVTVLPEGDDGLPQEVGSIYLPLVAR
ncbi:MAG: hypothetical protein GY713_14390 [Actinomycetia bacterium]|nr:hypothetical protein [Actinomycetes bacterium]